MSKRNVETLSDDGQARREAMLPALLGEMREVHARRRMRGRAAVMASVGLTLALVVVLALPKPGSIPVPEVAVETREGATESAAPSVRERIVVHAKIVQTDPAITERYIVRTGAHRAIVLSDDELIDTLEAIGRPAGLVRMNGRAWLTAAVTDEELRNGL